MNKKRRIDVKDDLDEDEEEDYAVEEEENQEPEVNNVEAESADPGYKDTLEED